MYLANEGTKAIELINFKLRTTETIIDISPMYPYGIVVDGKQEYLKGEIGISKWHIAN